MPRAGDVARVFAALAYFGGFAGLGVVTALLIYSVVRSRSPYAAYHCRQSMAITLATVIAIALFTLWVLALAALGAFNTRGPLGIIVALVTFGPAVAIVVIAGLLSTVGVIEAMAGRRTELPLVRWFVHRWQLIGSLGDTSRKRVIGCAARRADRRRIARARGASAVLRPRTRGHTSVRGTSRTAGRTQRSRGSTGEGTPRAVRESSRPPTTHSRTETSQRRCSASRPQSEPWPAKATSRSTQRRRWTCRAVLLAGCGLAAASCRRGPIPTKADGPAAAQASGACADHCTADAVACRGDALATCRVDPDGCGRWVTTTACASGYCSDEHTCGATRCEHERLLTCERPADGGCESWKSTPCPGSYCFDDQHCGAVRTMQYGSPDDDTYPGAAAIDGREVWIAGSASGALPGGSRPPSRGGFLMKVAIDDGTATTKQWPTKRIADPIAIAHGVAGPWVATRSLVLFTDPMHVLAFDDALTTRIAGWNSDTIVALSAAADGGIFIAHPGTIERRAADGTQQWSHKTVGSPQAIATVDDDELVVAARRNDTLVLQRLAADGSARWQQKLPLDRRDDVRQLVIDPHEGAIYLTGATSLGWAGRVGTRDWGVMKFADDGTRTWARNLGSIGWDTAPLAAVRPDGELVLAGVVGHRLLGGTRHGNIAMMRIDRDGNVASQTQWGASTSDDVTGLGIADGGRIVIAGRTYGQLGPTHGNAADVFVSVLEPDTAAVAGATAAPPSYTLLDDAAAGLPDRAGVHPPVEDPADAELLFVTEIDGKPYVVFPAPPQDAWRHGIYHMWGEPSVRAPVDLAALPPSIRAWIGRELRLTGGSPMSDAHTCTAKIRAPEITAADTVDLATASPDDLWLGPRRMLVAALAIEGRCKWPRVALPSDRPRPTWYRRTRPRDAAAKQAMRTALADPAVVALDRRMRAAKRDDPEARGSAREGAALELWSSTGPGVHAIRFSDGWEGGESLIVLVAAGDPMRVVEVLDGETTVELHDLDGDGAPELFTSDDTWELALHRREGDRWRLTAGLRALPPELE